MSNEAQLIEVLRAIATSPAARELKDDAAVLEIGGEALVLTHDMIVEGTHFLAGTDPADVAWKLVSTNMSDLAAKGAEPVGVLLGFMLGDNDARFAEGLKAALEHYQVALLGGDTTSGEGNRSYGLTAVGRAVHQPVPSRSGAQPDDVVWLTGGIGSAMMGFEALRDGKDDNTPETMAYLRPQARLEEGQALAPRVNAMMDVSDGLLLDAFRMAEASGVTIEIESGKVPVDAPDNRWSDALRWGDDYELLFTAVPRMPITIPATPIGKVSPRGDAPLILDGEKITSAEGLGYQH